MMTAHDDVQPAPLAPRATQPARGTVRRSTAMRRVCLCLVLGTIVPGSLMLAGCSREPAPAENADAAPRQIPLAVVPIELTVRQRSTTPIPGSDGKLLVTIDDVTRGQIMVSVVEQGQTALIGPVSMTPDMSLEFPWADKRYTLTLERLHNALVGEDFADFVVGEASPAAPPLTEKQKIERLIATILDLERATFVRNGKTHTSREAANHLREKWAAQADDVTTARDFIDKVASRSTLTGDSYRIQFPDGGEIDSAEFLRERLKELEAASGPNVAAQ